MKGIIETSPKVQHHFEIISSKQQSYLILSIELGVPQQFVSSCSKQTSAVAIHMEEVLFGLSLFLNVQEMLLTAEGMGSQRERWPPPHTHLQSLDCYYLNLEWRMPFPWIMDLSGQLKGINRGRDWLSLSRHKSHNGLHLDVSLFVSPVAGV